MVANETVQLIAADVDAEEIFRQRGLARELSWLHLYRAVQHYEQAEGRTNQYYTTTLLGLIDAAIQAEREVGE